MTSDKLSSEVLKQQDNGDRPPVLNQVDLETASLEELDPVKERKLLAKLDLAFVPVIMLVYLSCFLDRSNIGMPH